MPIGGARERDGPPNSVHQQGHGTVERVWCHRRCAQARPFHSRLLEPADASVGSRNTKEQLGNVQQPLVPELHWQCRTHRRSQSRRPERDWQDWAHIVLAKVGPSIGQHPCAVSQKVRTQVQRLVKLSRSTLGLVRSAEGIGKLPRTDADSCGTNATGRFRSRLVA